MANRSPASVLPSTCLACNGASVIGIRNIAKSQTQKCQTQGPEKKKQKKQKQNGEALARDTASPQHSLYCWQVVGEIACLALYHS